MLIFVQFKRLTLMGPQRIPSINSPWFLGLSMCLPFGPRQFGLLFHIKRGYPVFVFYMYIYTRISIQFRQSVCEIHAALLLLLQNVFNEY